MRLHNLVRSLVVVVSITSVGLACSQDYTIWMIRNKSADALFRFIRGGKAGYIDRSGKIVIPPTLDVSGNYGGEFHDGRLAISEIGNGEYIDINGKRAVDNQFFRGWEFSEGLAVAMSEPDGKWGYIDTSGRFVIAPQFERYPNGSVDSFSNGLAKIDVRERIGYIDTSGAFAIQPTFLSGTRFRDDRAWVVIDGPCMYFDITSGCPNFGNLPRSAADDASQSLCKYALIDRSGKVLSKQRFDAVGEFSEGLAAVQIGGFWGFVDQQGTIVIEPRFNLASPFSDGLARIAIRSGRFPQYGYIDRSGVIVIQPQFAFADSFSEELAVVAADIEGPYWFVGKNGRPAMPQKFALASGFAKGLAHVKISSNRKGDDPFDPKGRYAYIDRTGKQVFVYNR